MEKRKLDFTNCKNLDDIHMEIKKKLDFPEHYGENWDAMWDCLWEYYDRPVYIEISGFNSLSEEFSNAKRLMREVLDDAVEELRGFTYKIVS